MNDEDRGDDFDPTDPYGYAREDDLCFSEGDLPDEPDAEEALLVASVCGGVAA